IKEATISLREMTPATRAAIDGIGLSSATMQQQLRDGAISVFDAIQQISNRLAELPPQSSEVGTAIADIFRGAGEDAGLEYITMLGTAEMSLEKLKEGAGENAVAQEKLLQANQKLNQSWSEMMGTGTGTFTTIKAFAIDLLANGIAGLSKGIADVRDWFIELYNESLPVRAGFQYMFAMWKTGFTAVKVAVQSLWEQLKLGGKLIKAVLTFDLDGIKEAFREYGENMKSTVADNSQKLAETWKNAWNNTIDGKLKPVKQVVEVDTVVSGSTGTQPGAAGATQTQDTGVPTRTGTSFEEMETISDPRIKSEEQFTEAVLEETKLRQQALDNEQKAAVERAVTEEQLQQQKREAYLSTLDTIIDVFGQESAIGKAALLAKQAYAIAETIINIAKGTGESAAAAPFPANIPLIIGFVGQVAGLIATIEGAGKKTKGYAMGKYPILAEDGKTYNAKYAGRPETGFYNGPHYALFNEVPGQPELIVDGVTTRDLQINAPEIIRAIYDVRDGRTPRYAEGKYPVPANNNSNENSTGITLDNKIARELISAIHAFTNKKLVVYSEMIKKDIELLNDIENQRNI
ncbi:MAG: hypothetical protein JXR61_06190, partial [Prolixibacteraceae bacterium]|nr:hypothetical protein [Prolixibacteraceae bacterium]